MPKKESGSESTEPSGPVPYVEAVLEWPEGTHVLAIGKSGSAKTSTLIQLVKDQSRVIYLTTKGGEHGDHVPPGWVSALLNDLDEITFLKQIQGVIDLIYKLLKQDAPFTLIIDEALDMKETVHDFMKSLSKSDKENFPSNLSDLYLSALRKVLTKGRSAKHRLALVTQNPNGTAIFGQARLTEGFSKVLCTSERESSPFSNALSWANQLYEGKLTPENRKFLRTLKSGYWHFWLKDNQLHGGHPSPTPDDMVKPKPFDLHRMLRDLKVINPIPEEAMPQSEVFTPSSPVPPAPPDSSPKAGLEDRILSTLILKGIPMSLGELKDATKMAGEKSDDYRARAEPIIQRFLHEGLITEHVINGTVKYRTARSVQGPGNI